MNDSIICPNCKSRIPLSEAISHQVEDQFAKKLQDERDKAKLEKDQLIKLSIKRIEEERQKAKLEAESVTRKKITEEMELAVKNQENEMKELKDEKKLLQEQLLELNKIMRQLQNQSREKELEMQKKFTLEQDKWREDERKSVEEQYKMKILEKEKKLMDIQKVNEDLKRKLEQGSQQLQGEVLELAMEELLRREFPQDTIRPVPKGVSGADILQIVKNSQGSECGKIVWEAKRTKSWSLGWVTKLKEDQRAIGAELAVIVSQVLPDGISRFGLRDGIWICDFESIIGASYALRNQLLEISTVKKAQSGKQGKTQEVYDYITSTEFRHRVETIIEAFSGMQSEIERERRWFAQKWAREERHLRKVLDTTHGLKGDLQLITGKITDDDNLLEADLSESSSKKDLPDESESTLF